MKVNLLKIAGNWDQGYVLDKRIISSTRDGEWPNGRPRFNTIRTEAGEASYQLKFQGDYSQVPILAASLAKNIYPLFSNVGLIVPMPASTERPRQPVTEVSKALGELVGRPVFEQLLLKAPTGRSLKDLETKAEKLAEIGDSLSVHDVIKGDGPLNVLLIDDLFQSGASMEKACTVLRTYPKIRNIYVAAMSWSPE